MSDTDNSKPTTPAAEQEQPSGQTPGEPREEAAPRERRKTGAPIAWIALIMALGALAGAAYLIVDRWRSAADSQQSETAFATISETLGASLESLDGLEQRLDALAEKDVASTGELQSIERRLNERLEGLDSLPSRVLGLEGAVGSLQGISTGARNTWLLAEAEYYMQIANAQLQLAGNPRLAALALEFADERLLELRDPGLTEVRRALSDELRAIEVIQAPDIEGVSLTLASLAGVIDSLPLRQEMTSKDEQTGEVDPEASGIDRALASVRKAVGEVVSVRRTDQALEPFIPPEAAYFLRANLSLQLQTARLALLRNERRVFEQTLDDAAGWLSRYYDTSSPPVTGALETIAEIRNRSYSVSLPDISGSLRLLRQHIARSEPETPADGRNR